MGREYQAQQTIRKQLYLSQDATDQCISSTAIKMHQPPQVSTSLNFPKISSKGGASPKKQESSNKRYNKNVKYGSAMPRGE